MLSTPAGLSGGSALLMAIFFSEIHRARVGWLEPEIAMRTLRANYLPGDLGFDPLNLKPEDDKDFLAIQNKELNNGRLAMIGCLGIVAQELVTGLPLFG